MKRRHALALVASLLLGLPACDDADVRGAATDAGAAADAAGPMSRPDGSTEPPPGADAGPSSDAGGAGIDAGTGETDAEYDSSGLDAAAARAACFDGDDNDGDGRFDCADLSCQTNVPSCCVGQSSATCCSDGAEHALALTGCGPLLSSCAMPGVPFTAFGSPAPGVRTFAADGVPSLVPGGQAADGGALLDRLLDPRAGAVRLSATIASPLEAPASGRVETVAVGFVDASVDASSLTRVAPIAGVVVSRSRAEVLLVIAGDVVQRWELLTEAPVTYTLELDPTGRVRLAASSGGIAADVAYPIDAPVRAVVYGRTANPTETIAPARLLGMSVTPTVCDMPAALARSAEPVVPAPGADTTWADGLVRIGEPDVLRYEDPPGTEQVRMALVVDGDIYLATPGSGGFELTTLLGEPVMARPAQPWAVEGVSDPALVRIGDQLELLFTGWSGGRGTIARALWDTTTERFVVDGPVPGLEASGGTGFSSIAPFSLGGVPHAVVRVDDATGQRLALYSLGAGAELVLRELRAPHPTDVFAFDRDEVDGPAVLVRGGVYRLYFAGRRGTRWSLGLLVSDDGVDWHEPAVGKAVLSPSGAGFDALGVRDPAFDLVGDQLRLYYAGDDGERVRVGVAVER